MPQTDGRTTDEFWFHELCWHSQAELKNVMVLQSEDCTKNCTAWEHSLSGLVWTECPTRPHTQGAPRGGCYLHPSHRLAQVLSDVPWPSSMSWVVPSQWCKVANYGDSTLSDRHPRRFPLDDADRERGIIPHVQSLQPTRWLPREVKQRGTSLPVPQWPVAY